MFLGRFHALWMRKNREGFATPARRLRCAGLRAASAHRGALLVYKLTSFESKQCRESYWVGK